MRHEQPDGAELGGAYTDVLNWYWNDYLRQSYPSTAALREAWGASTPAGPSLLPAEWRPLEIHAGAQASLAVSGGVARVTVANGSNTVILKKTGFSLQEGQTYAASVEIRADQPCTVYWDVKQDVSPWRTAASRNLSVTTEWQRFTLAVTPAFSMDAIGRFGLSLAACPAPVEVRNESLAEPGIRGLHPDESLEAESVARPGAAENSAPARLDDYLRFLALRDRVYLESLAAPVRARPHRGPVQLAHPRVEARERVGDSEGGECVGYGTTAAVPDAANDEQPRAQENP